MGVLRTGLQPWSTYYEQIGLRHTNLQLETQVVVWEAITWCKVELYVISLSIYICLYCLAEIIENKILGSIMCLSSPTLNTLDAYLAAPIPSIQAIQEPLAPMSHAYLSTPGKTFNLCDFVSQNWHLLTAASTDIELGFLKGRLNVSQKCYSLSDESMHVTTVLGPWASILGFANAKELVSNMHDKQFRQTTIYNDDIFMVEWYVNTCWFYWSGPSNRNKIPGGCQWSISSLDYLQVSLQMTWQIIHAMP